jgi:hypothetical protein
LPGKRLACQTGILPEIQTMNAQEILLEEIKRQRAREDWSDVLPAREVEQEILDIVACNPGGHTKSRRPDGSAGSD